MFKIHVLSSLLFITATTSFATEPSTGLAQNAPTVVPSHAVTQPSLQRPNQNTKAMTFAGQVEKQQFNQQLARLQLLEKANQNALAQNQELQLKNDNLSVQVQVLQSERSAQMFLYGAVTFATGLIVGVILYSVLYTRRRKW